MIFYSKKTRNIFLEVALLFLISGSVSAQDETINLQFEQPPVSDSDTSRTLQSLVKVQGTGQFCEDGLYLMTHYGDREEIFQIENQEMIDNPLINQTWRHCSLFSSTNEDSVVMGRNWDNQNVGSIIVSLYYPPKGYSSISFTRSISMGFGHKDLEPHKSSIFGNKLLLAPFYAFDGINEHGLAVGVAGVNHVTLSPVPNKELVYAPFLIRKILDQTKNIEEAASLVDIDKDSLNTHYFIVDASGRSVVLEYTGDHWEKIYGDKSWQVMTTRPIFNVPDADLREECWRYRSISENLENAGGNVDWKIGMKVLQNATQKGTTWSIVYSLAAKELYFSVYQKWENIYYLRMP